MALLPETEEEMYEVYGRYGNQLIYRIVSREDGHGILESLNLETGEITRPLGERNVNSRISMDGDLAACAILENGDRRVVELGLDTGEWRETAPELGEAAILFWSLEMKTATVYEDGGRYKVYQYLDDGTCRLVRDEDDSSYREVIAVKDGRGVGVSYKDMGAQFRMAFQEKEDYLAGKNNWTVMEY